jgi:folate-dependent phosphoribosylglycinamide formyltransferase PurN
MRGKTHTSNAAANLEAELLEAQKAHDFGAMGLTFNRLITQNVIDAFRGRIFNLHMSLLPMFPGFGATRKRLLRVFPMPE